jgi:hypothetical protein
MLPYAFLIATALSAGPAVTATPLSGDPTSGTLTAITIEAVQLEAADGPQTLDLNSLRSLTFTGVEPPDQFADPPAVEVQLTDGTRFACTALTSQVDKVRLSVEDVGDLALPRSALRAVRLASPEKIAPRWEELLQRENTADMLVVRKQDALDFVEGTVGDIGPKEITFLIQGQSRTLPRERAFGVVFAKPQVEAPRASLAAHAGRSTLQLAAVALEGDQIAATLAAGPKVSLPLTAVRTIEFSGRVRFLGDLTPAIELPQGVAADEQYRYFRRGNEPFGAPLRVGADEIITTEGLWMHSGVTAKYRINRDYRRFVTLVGMDHNVGGNRKVRLVISGDGKPLFDEIIAWAQPARELDLDVAGIRDLEIKVESPEESRKTNIFGIQEHLDLGNARLVR